MITLTLLLDKTLDHWLNLSEMIVKLVVVFVEDGVGFLDFWNFIN